MLRFWESPTSLLALISTTAKALCMNKGNIYDANVHDMMRLECFKVVPKKKSFSNEHLNTSYLGTKQENSKCHLAGQREMIVW